MFSKINTDIQSAFETVVKKYIQEDVTFVMPAFYPQRGGILQDVVALGGKAIIAGGAPHQQLFKGIPQYSPGYDTTGISETPKEIHEIVKAIPSEEVRDKKVALFVEAPVGKFWSQNLKLKGADIVSSNEQNLRLFFEEKVNLQKILTEAGLEECFIPSEVVKVAELDNEGIKKLYHQYKGDTGFVVIQSCGSENFESGGGKGTNIAKSAKQFAQMIMQHKGDVKVAQYINGYCSNLSMFVGNQIPNKDGLGMSKTSLTKSDNAFSPETLHILQSRGQALGLSADKVVVLPARASLKAIGDKNLTKSQSNGVGNALGYDFSPEINNKVEEIANKLGSLMGQCGKVGLCGADLIIQGNKIFINEINDRQQGPTEQLSLDAEKSGLAGIHRLAFLANYADCQDPQINRTFYNIQKHSHELYQQNLQSDGSFYIKMMGKQQGDATSIVDLKSGIYALEKKQGKWTWDFSTSYESGTNIDLSQDKIYVGLAGVSLEKGQTVPSGAQILRIVGMARNGSSPFNIQEGKVSLNPKWTPIVNSLYSTMFGKNYNQQQQQKQLPKIQKNRV